MKHHRGRPRLAFCFTAHGYGHLTRTLAVLAELLDLAPSVEVTVCADAPAWLIESSLPRPVELRQVAYEPGTAQKSCFEVDAESTRAAYAQLRHELPDRVRAEREFLASRRVAGVVVDVPAVPVRAAAELGIPVVGLGNFTWDWILEPILAASDVELLRAGYSTGDLYLEYPFGPGVSPFATLESAPLVGRRSLRSRADVLESLGRPDWIDRPVLLVCVGGWGAREWRRIEVDVGPDTCCIVVDELPLDIDSAALFLPNQLPPGLAFPDLVAAADAILTKPGYGIASESLLARTPLIGIERRGFREAPLLVEGLERAGPFAQISLDDFFTGSWRKGLEEVLGSTRAWTTVEDDGARQVAERIACAFGLV